MYHFIIVGILIFYEIKLHIRKKVINATQESSHLLSTSLMKDLPLNAAMRSSLLVLKRHVIMHLRLHIMEAQFIKELNSLLSIHSRHTRSAECPGGAGRY